MKICPNCREKHNNSRSEYCCRTIVNNCLHCGNPKETKCRKSMKVYCTQNCSMQHKKNDCLNCGEPCRDKYCKKEIKINCKHCGKEHFTKCAARIGLYCSGVCAARDPEIKEKAKQTQLANHGGVYAFNTPEQRETMIKRYGDITPAKNLDVKKKAKETQFKNHGGVYAFNTPEQNESMMKKYNSLGRLGSPEELKKHHALTMSRHGVKTPSEHPEFLAKAMKTIIENNGQLFGNGNKISKVNLLFGEKIKRELGVDVEYEFPLGGSFFDIYIPEKNIAVELNPTITHNSSIAFACKRNRCEIQPCEKHKPLEKDYHYKKSKLAMDNNVKLIQLFEWESQEEIIEMIKQKVIPFERKFSARQLEMKKITQKTANDFLKHYHIQKNAKGQTHCYALFNGEEILAVATFGKSRFKSKYDYEFIRYAVKSGVQIHGSASKLVKEFIKEEQPSSIVSYIDFNHTTSKEIFLNSCGFKEEKATGSRLVFHNRRTNKMVPMTSLLMIGADKILGTNYGSKETSGLDNEGIMLKEGFLKVFTSGNRVFVWSRENETEKENREDREEQSNATTEKEKVLSTCQMCKKEFIQKNKSNDGVIGCSPTCRFQLRNGPRPCVVCSKDFYPKAKKSKVCSMKCSGKLGQTEETNKKRKETREKNKTE